MKGLEGSRIPISTSTSVDHILHYCMVILVFWGSLFKITACVALIILSPKQKFIHSLIQSLFKVIKGHNVGSA